MFFHLILTTECNLACSYCCGEAELDARGNREVSRYDVYLPVRISYSIQDLQRFCSLDPECSLIFYGGEPLLEVERMQQIMDAVHARRFIIQTNGLLLHKLGAEYLKRLHTIAVSIDGREGTTDAFRGAGTFRRVIRNLKLLMARGFSGELIARMTVMEPVDIYEEVRWLLNNDEFSFGSVHWQLNAGFWHDFGRRDFERWVERSYNPGIRRLARFWVEELGRGRVLRLYPFLGIVKSLLSGRPAELRCGAGWANYAIQTDGHIVPCPSMWGMREFYLGHVRYSHPLRLPKVFVEAWCRGCRIRFVCGGRCLYANVMRRWSADAYRIVCRTVENLVEALRAQLPEIRRCLREGVVRLEDFEFLEFNGCEIIP